MGKLKCFQFYKLLHYIYIPSYLRCDLIKQYKIIIKAICKKQISFTLIKITNVLTTIRFIFLHFLAWLRPFRAETCSEYKTNIVYIIKNCCVNCVTFNTLSYWNTVGCPLLKLAPVLKLMIWVHAIWPCFFKIHCNIFPSTHRSSKWSLSSFLTKTLRACLFFPVCHMSHPPHPHWFNHYNSIWQDA